MLTSIWWGTWPLIGGVSLRRPRTFHVEADVQALLARMRQRLYPDTFPALASFWLKTLYCNGYNKKQWYELSHLLKTLLREPILDDASREVITEIDRWVQEEIAHGGNDRRCSAIDRDTSRVSVSGEHLITYIVRLLNEWLPIEVARLSLDDREVQLFQNDVSSCLAIGTALELLLVRKQLSWETLEMLLDPPGLSPEHVYSSDFIMLQDVVLSLLGRTTAPARALMSAALVCVPTGSPLPAEYREAVRRAYLIRWPACDEVHVPITPAVALETIKVEPLRIGSIIVTMDGRLWESESLQSGGHCAIVYRPVGHLRIEYSEENTSLRVPWPEQRLRWSGSSCCKENIRIFGREWRISKWEVEAERTWAEYVFCRVLPISEIVPGLHTTHLRPAYVDMAWAALEMALVTSLTRESGEPIERLRRSDFIPIGRAILKLAEPTSVRTRRTYDAIITQLRDLQRLEKMVVSEYGPIPWKVLPAIVRARLSRLGSHPEALELLNEVIAELPEPLHYSIVHESGGPSSPPHVA